MRLATKIIASSLAVIILLTAIAGYFSVRNKYQEFELAQRKLAQATATAIRHELTRAWQAEGLAGVVQFLEGASLASDGALQIRWVWLDDQALPQERPRLTISDGSIPFGDTFSLVADNEYGQRFLFTYVPVQLTTSRPGALEFAESLRPLEQRMWGDVWLTLGWIGAIAMVSIAMAYVTGISWVARPLQSLIAKTQRIGQGDFSQPLTLDTRDELGQLAQALNEMCDQLERQQNEIASESEKRLAVLDQLRHSDRLKTVGRLAAGVGHELGTPLNVISGRAGLITTGKLSDAEIQSSARVIKEEAERVTEIVRQLLDFARRRPPSRATMDLTAVVSRTIELLQPIADRSHVRIVFERNDSEPALTKPVAPADQTLVLGATGSASAEASRTPAGGSEKAEESADRTIANVLADAGQLQQVFTNIIVNAIQAMPNGGEARVKLFPVVAHNPVAAEETPDADYWCISITDQGVGIKPENLAHIFEPFFTTKDVHEGTGLGLSIAYGIVHEHQGWIGVSSQLGAGSRFDVFLPKGQV